MAQLTGGRHLACSIRFKTAPRASGEQDPYPIAVLMRPAFTIDVYEIGSRYATVSSQAIWLTRDSTRDS